MLYTNHSLINVRCVVDSLYLAYAQNEVDAVLFFLVFLARQATRRACQCSLIYPHTAARRLKRLLNAKVSLDTRGVFLLVLSRNQISIVICLENCREGKGKLVGAGNMEAALSPSRLLYQNRRAKEPPLGDLITKLCQLSVL